MEDFKIVNVMHRYGGSFARALAEAAQSADPVNIAKIKATWPEMWAEYREMAELIQRRDKDQEASHG